MMRLRLLILLLLLPVATQAADPVSVPQVDVRANVMKMLQQGEKAGTATVIPEEHSFAEPLQQENLPPSTSGQKPTPAGDDLFEQAREQEAQRKAGAKAATELDKKNSIPPQTKPESAPSPAKPSTKNDDHLPLPNKVITIHGVEDVQQLSDEFDAAKKRQQEK